MRAFLAHSCSTVPIIRHAWLAVADSQPAATQCLSLPNSLERSDLARPYRTYCLRSLVPRKTLPSSGSALLGDLLSYPAVPQRKATVYASAARGGT